MTHLNPIDERAVGFTRLYLGTYSDLLRFVQRRVAPDSAEDVVADAFLTAWRRLGDLPRQHGDARAWLFGIARGIILNTHRSTERQRALGVRLAEVRAAPSAAADEFVAHRLDLARAWGLLTDRQQEVLALAVLDDLTAPQAAAVLGISPVAFRVRLSRARRALRLHLGLLSDTSVPTHAFGRTCDGKPA